MSLRTVNLHGHCQFSTYDAISSPEDYVKWMLKNTGEDSGALAITDHGNMNSIGSIASIQKKYEGKAKLIFGNEMYFVPSLKEWRELKQKSDELKKQEKKNKKKKTIAEEDDASDFVIEDEQESKTKQLDPLKRRNHIVLNALNYEGLKNLYRLTSKSYQEGFYKKPRIDIEMLREYNQGLIVSTACISSPFSYLSQKYLDEGDERVFKAYDEELFPLMEIFGKDRFFLELQFNFLKEQEVLNKHLIEYSKRTGYKLIVTSDAHYPNPEAAVARQLYRLLGLQMLKKEVDISTIEGQANAKADLYLKNGDQLFDWYKKTFAHACSDEKLITEAIERSYDIAHNLIEDVRPDKTPKFPKSIVVENSGETSFDFLKKKCFEELNKKGLIKDKTYFNRLVKELKTIKKLGVEDYFLVLKDIVEEVRKIMLLGPGRGSGASSLVNYLLGITLLDPIKHDLLFERFLSLSRKGLPDIDSDIEDKDTAFKILQEKYGEKNVLAVSNFNRLQLKSLIKDISRLFDIPFQEVNELTKIIEDEAKDKILAEINYDQKLYAFTYEKAKEYSPSFQNFIKKYPNVDKHIAGVFGEIKSIGKHAGGIIIVPNAEDHLPIIKIRGTLQSPIVEGLNAQHLQQFGLIKYDLLGLATLRTIRACIENILKTNGILNPTMEDVWNFYNENLHPDIIDTNDAKVYKNVYHNGKFPGIFQFMEKDVQNFVTKAKPETIGDIACITSLERPGPLCLSADTQILTGLSKNFGKLRHKIKDLYERFHNPNRKNDVYIISYNEENMKFFRNKIKNIYKSGIKAVYKIKFQVADNSITKKYRIRNSIDKHGNGFFIIKSTLEHKFLTNNGWKELKDLTNLDYLFTRRKVSFHLPKINKKPSTVYGRKNFRNICFRNYIYKCIFCDWNEGSLDVNHIDGNRNTNNNPENLCYLCPNHHRIFSEGKIEKSTLIEAREKYKIPCTEEIRLIRFLEKEFVGYEETYDIEVEGTHHNFIAGGFIVHNSGHADKKYLINKNETNIEYDHPILEKILGYTKGILCYQEQFMTLANELAGFSLEESDDLRKLLVKPAKELGPEMVKKREEAGKKFIDGCVKKGLSLERAQILWNKEILGFISYGFVKPHAYAYSYNSYHCAWLFTYHQDEWIKACLETDPDPSGMKNIVKGLGYTIKEIDINLSHGTEWTVKNGECIPPISSVKSIGDKAIEELEKIKPIKSVYDFWNENNKWKFSKFNIRALGNLIKLGAFKSLDCVGEDKTIKNYKQMHNIFVENIKELKKKKGKENLEEIVLKTSHIKDWTQKEKFDMHLELTGEININLLISNEKIKELRENDINSIDNYDKKGRYWFYCQGSTIRKTKYGKEFEVITTLGKDNKSYKIYLWNFESWKHKKLNKDRIYLVEGLTKNNYGFQSFKNDVIESDTEKENNI